MTTPNPTTVAKALTPAVNVVLLATAKAELLREEIDGYASEVLAAGSCIYCGISRFVFALVDPDDDPCRALPRPCPTCNRCERCGQLVCDCRKQAARQP